MLSDIRMGAYAVAPWWFNGGVPMGDCWTAVNSTPPPPNSNQIPETFNAIKILARSLPQAQGAAAVLSSDFDFSVTGGKAEAVAINAAPTGAPPRLVLWFLNKGMSPFTFSLTVNGVTSGQTLAFDSDVLQGVSPYAVRRTRCRPEPRYSPPRCPPTPSSWSGSGLSTRVWYRP